MAVRIDTAEPEIHTDMISRNIGVGGTETQPRRCRDGPSTDGLVAGAAALVMGIWETTIVSSLDGSQDVEMRMKVGPGMVNFSCVYI